MKKFGLKTVTWYGLLGLIIMLAFLPILKASAPQYFPTVQGFTAQTPDQQACIGVSCDEGQFCGSGGKCTNIASRYPNAVPHGNM